MALEKNGMSTMLNFEQAELLFCAIQSGQAVMCTKQRLMVVMNAENIVSCYGEKKVDPLIPSP